MEFEKSATRKNVAKAYASECQDSARYQLMSLIAHDDKQFEKAEQIKRLAKRELAHATILYHTLTQNGTKNMDNVEFVASFPFESVHTEDGILTSAQGEHAQAQNIYPSFAAVAKDEGFASIATLFTMLAEVEEDNEKWLERLLKPSKGERLICTNCGYSKKAKKVWHECPLCGKGKGFAHFDENNE